MSILSGRRKGLCILSKVSKTWGFCGTFKNSGNVRHSKRICKDAFCQETSLMVREGADFLREVAVWGVRPSGLVRWLVWQVQHFVWPGFTFARQAQYFRQMKWKMHWYEAVSQLCIELSIFEGSLSDFICFWWCQLEKLKRSGSNASFWTLACSKNEEISQNCCVFDVVRFENSGCLAE